MEVTVDIRNFDSPVPEAFHAMTFPAYRHLLDLCSQPRHPEEGDLFFIRPVAIGAYVNGTAAAFLLAEIPMLPERQPELLSVYTAQGVRNKGLATALVAAFEDYVAEFGLPEVGAVYMTGKPSVPGLERVFEKSGWEGPTMRSIALRFAPDELTKMPWYGRLQLDPAKYEIFSWTELRDAERDEIRRSNDDQPWIRPGLEHWHYDAQPYDEASSLGVRYRGKVLGWVINHPIQSGVLRYTCSFIRPDHGRRGRILPLFTESNERVRRSDWRMCSMIAPARFETMVRFVRRRMAPWLSSVEETRQFTKRVVSPPGQ